MLRSFLLPLSVAAVTPLAHAQCPSPSSAFGIGGPGDIVHDLVTADLGGGPAIYAAGRFGAAGDVVSPGVARWDGTSWSALGSGVDVDSGTVWRVAAVDWGGPRIAALGEFESVGGAPAAGVALWDGMQWDVLAGGPLTGAGVELLDAAVFDAGGGPALYVAGRRGDPSSFGELPLVARWDGARWEVLANGPEAEPCGEFNPWCSTQGFIGALAVFDDGGGDDLYAAGQFVLGGGLSGFNLARWDGTTWSAPDGDGFGGPNGHIAAMTEHDDGSGPALYLRGSLVNEVDPRLLRWDGAVATAVGATPSDIGTEMEVLPATAAGPAGLWLLRSFESDGFVSARVWDGSAWGSFSIPTHYSAETDAIGALGGELYVGGWFRSVGGTPAGNLARHVGPDAWATTTPVGEGFVSEFGDRGRVGAIALHDDPATGLGLYAGGEIVYAGGEQLACLARWEGGSWTPIPGLLLPYSSDVVDMVSADIGDGPSLYLVGKLKVPSENLVGVVRWDGTTFHSVGFDDDTTHDAVAFTHGGIERLYVASRSWVYEVTSQGSQMIASGGSSAQVYALEVHDDGTGPALYAAGRFDSLEGATSFSVARWDGSAWSAVGIGIGDGVSHQSVYVLRSAVGPEGPRLYAGGKFTLAGGEPASNLAAWDGSSWSEVGGGVDGDFPGVTVPVTTIEGFDDGAGQGPVLYVGGRFTSAGGQPARNLARWDGSTWTPLDSVGSEPVVRALQAVHLSATGGRALAVGGNFDGVAGAPASGFELLDACDATGELFCFGDGSDGACPCANESLPGEEAGCVHSFGEAAALRATGGASLLNDTLLLSCTGLPDSPGLYFQAAGRVPGFAFGDGVKCTSGPFVRLGAKFASGGASSYPDLSAGDLSASVKGLLIAPGTVHYQIHYRNAMPFCTPAAFNMSNGVSVDWGL